MGDVALHHVNERSFLPDDNLIISSVGMVSINFVMVLVRFLNNCHD